MENGDLPARFIAGRGIIFPIVLFMFLVCMQGCQQELIKPQNLLKPPKGDLMNPPKIFDSRQEYGHLQTATAIVPSTADIFLAKSETGTIIRHPNGQEDISPG